MPVSRMTKMELPRLLLQRFPELESMLVQEMAQVGELAVLQEGKPAIQAGQQFRSMIFVLDGTVKVFRQDNHGAEFYMYSLKAGSVCALSLSCSDRAELSAVKGQVIEEGMALVIPLEYMEQWLTRYRSWGRFVIKALHNKIEEVLTTFDQVAFRNLDERLEFYLEKMREQAGSSMLHLSHQQIADDLNTSREVVSRLLKKLEQRGRIAMHRNAIEIRQSFPALQIR